MIQIIRHYIALIGVRFVAPFRARFPELKDFDPIIQIILLFPGDINLIGIMSITIELKPLTGFNSPPG